MDQRKNLMHAKLALEGADMPIDTVTPEALRSILEKALLLGSGTTLRDAADTAERMALRLESGDLPPLTAADACRYLAAIYGDAAASADRAGAELEITPVRALGICVQMH